MASTPVPVNPVATGVSTAIGTVGGDIVSVTESMIVADSPWLGFPVLKQLWEALFAWIVGYFIKAAQTGATFAIIDVQVSSEESGMSKALAALYAAEKTGEKNAIQTAIQNYANAQSALVHDDGSVPLS